MRSVVVSHVVMKSAQHEKAHTQLQAIILLPTCALSFERCLKVRVLLLFWRWQWFVMQPYPLLILLSAALRDAFPPSL